jgi:hypothetical protein
MLKDVDLRDWFGLIANEEINIRKVVDVIKQSPVIPQEIPVYGLMINTQTGELKEVYRYQELTVKPNISRVSELPTSSVQEFKTINAALPEKAQMPKPEEKKIVSPPKEVVKSSQEALKEKLLQKRKEELLKKLGKGGESWESWESWKKKYEKK